MDDSVWRFRSRIIAYVQLVFSIIQLIFGFLIVILGIGVTAVVVANKDDEKIKDEPIGAYLILLWIAVAVMSLVIIINLWATIMLLRATRLGEDPRNALRRAEIWRIVNIVFLIFTIIFYGGSQSFIFLVLDVLFQILLIYIVSKFISELRIFNASSGSVPNNADDKL